MLKCKPKKQQQGEAGRRDWAYVISGDEASGKIESSKVSGARSKSYEEGCEGDVARREWRR